MAIDQTVRDQAGLAAGISDSLAKQIEHVASSGLSHLKPTTTLNVFFCAVYPAAGADVMSLATRTILTLSIMGLGMLTFVSLRHFTSLRTELPLIMLLFVLLARFVPRKNREKVPWVPEIVEKQILLGFAFFVGFLVAFFFGPFWLQILLIVAWIGVAMALELAAIRRGPSKGTAVQS